MMNDKNIREHDMFKEHITDIGLHKANGQTSKVRTKLKTFEM